MLWKVKRNLSTQDPMECITQQHGTRMVDAWLSGWSQKPKIMASLQVTTDTKRYG